MEVMRSLPNESVDLIVTDVPYRTTARGCAGNSGGMLQKEINKKGRVFNFNSIKCSEYLPEFFRVLKEGSHCYIMTNHLNLREMLNEAEKVGLHFIKSLIWLKDNKIMGKWYMSQFEYILFFRKGKAVPINCCGTSDVLQVPNKKLKDRDGINLHDTEKPVKLMEQLVLNSSKEGDFVMDPFMGIGSTGIACKKNGRNFIGVELDPKYFYIAGERIKNA
jgi:site-specific DNA-methyltransferase (adenine-specific)